MLSDDDSGFEFMDDSLTDMQWLQRMDAGMYALSKFNIFNHMWYSETYTVDIRVSFGWGDWPSL